LRLGILLPLPVSGARTAGEQPALVNLATFAYIWPPYPLESTDQEDWSEIFFGFNAKPPRCADDMRTA
jgi:hypothetical protein